MSAMKEIAYDIEQLYIDGFSPSRIANILECPIGLVYDWLEDNNMGVAETPQEDYNPFDTVNS